MITERGCARGWLRSGMCRTFVPDRGDRYRGGVTDQSDSGPNLGVRGVGFLLVVAGLVLISTGWHIRKGTSRLPVPPALTIYGFGAFALAGAVVVMLGAILLGAGV